MGKASKAMACTGTLVATAEAARSCTSAPATALAVSERNCRRSIRAQGSLRPRLVKSSRRKLLGSIRERHAAKLIGHHAHLTPRHQIDGAKNGVSARRPSDAKL